MREINNCICCGENISNSNFLFNKRNVKYYRCNKCNLVYQNPQPIYEMTEDIYDGLHYHERFIETEEVYLSTAKIYLDELNKELIKLKDQTNKKNINLLDIGCGIGYFLSLAKKDGYDVMGTDISKWVANYVKEHHGIKVVSGNFLELKLPENYFDVITMWQVIEHLPQPNLFLKKIFTLLNPGGILVIATPHVDNWFAQMYKSNWNCFMPDEHLGLFNLESMKLILEKNNFDLITVKSIRDRRLFPEQVDYFKLFNIRLIKNIILKTKIFKPLVPSVILSKWVNQTDLQIPLPSISYSVFAIGMKTPN